MNLKMQVGVRKVSVCRAVVQSDRSLIHFLDTACCSDLGALFISARMSACKAQNATASCVPFV